MQEIYATIPEKNAGVNADIAQLLSTSCDAAWVWEPLTEAFNWIYGADAFANTSHTGLASWTNNIHPDDREGIISSLLAAGDNTIPWQRQYRYQRGDGSWPVNLNKVMEAVLGDFELQRKETGATMTCDYLPTIEAIGLQMNQLF
jgi:hypothetical protein